MNQSNAGRREFFQRFSELSELRFGSSFFSKNECANYNWPFASRFRLQTQILIFLTVAKGIQSASFVYKLFFWMWACFFSDGLANLLWFTDLAKQTETARYDSC